MANFGSAGVPPRAVDERSAQRKKTLLGGKVVFGEAPTVRDCTIRNLSNTGAKITLAKGDVIPTRVFLIDTRTAMAYEATVSWIKAPEFGLRFLSAHHVKKTLPEELQFLRSVWDQFCSPLSSLD